MCSLGHVGLKIVSEAHLRRPTRAHEHLFGNMSRPATDYFLVQQPEGICKDSKTLILFFLALWVPPVVFSLTIGSSVARNAVGVFTKWQSRSTSYGIQVALSLLGSFVLHISAWNVAVVTLLRKGNEDLAGSFKHLYWSWYIRPMPATIILLLSAICPPLYLENAMEMQLVEGMIGLPTIGIYSWITQATRQRSRGDLSWAAEQHEWEQMRRSSQVGIAFWSIAFGALVLLLMILVVANVHIEGVLTSNMTKRTFWPSAIITYIRANIESGSIVTAIFWLSVVFNLGRTGVGFGIWSSLDQLDAPLFCPSLATTGTIAAMATSITFVDHVFRALLCVGRVRWAKLDGIWELHHPKASANTPLDIVKYDVQEQVVSGEGAVDMRKLVELSELLLQRQLRMGC